MSVSKALFVDVKPRPDIINALPIKISRLQFKACPD